jgi:hypothetical protein
VANRKGEFFMSLVKAAAGIFGRIATGGGLKAIDPGTDLQLQSLQTDVQKFEEEFLLEGRKESGKPEEIATAESLRLLDNFRMLSKCRAKQYAWAWKHQNVFRSAINTLRLARRSYRSIGDYADSVKTVLTGGPGPSLQVALDAVSKRYTDALAADFLGLRQSLSWTPSYQLEPERGHESLSKVVFQIASCGVKINSEVKPFKNPAPGGIRCAPIKEGQPEPDFREVALTVSRRSNELISRAEKLFPEYDKAGNGLAFIVPGQATVSVSNSGIELTDPVIDIAQWGFATRLPDGLVDKDNGGIKVSYYEATGALKSIKVVSKARLNSSMVDNVAGSVMTALDAKLKADAEEAKKAKADADELLQLQRQRQILEEKKKIKEACDFLKISCEN